MTQLAIAEAGPTPSPLLSQWFTDPKLAAALVDMARNRFVDSVRRNYSCNVLEPSAGRGHLVRAVLDICPRATVHACEIDPRWRPDLEVLIPTAQITIGDYLTQPAQRYDIGVSNPPFDDGIEVDHIAKMLDECDRLLLVLPDRSMHGLARHERIWSRMGVDWWLRQEKRLITRPLFGRTDRASHGRDEITLLDLRRQPGPCDVGWL